MNAFLKYLGLIIEVIGVIFLIVPKLMSTTSNNTLVAGGACMVIGIATHVVVNRKVK